MADKELSTDNEASVFDDILPNAVDQQTSVAEILHKFQRTIHDPKTLDETAEHLYQELVDDAVFGVFIELHHLRKTGNLLAVEGVPENSDNCNMTNSNAVPAINSITRPLHSSAMTSTMAATMSPTLKSASLRIVDLPNYDIFGMSTAKKPMDCGCPNCDRLVSAARFAPHLEKCMGMGRLSSRIASRRLATKENASSGASTLSTGLINPPNFALALTPYVQQSGNATDDEDDVDWSLSEKRRKKSTPNSRSNGHKKSNGKTFS